MDRRDVVRWLRSNPDVDVTGLANEAKAEWDCTLCSDRAIRAEASEGGDIRIPHDRNGVTTAHVYLKPDDAAAFARHILELVKS